uniref:ATP synthase F0 subunit 8 n=1 Tax=Pselaphanus sp. QL-2013 TaxID=1421598 RepID=A0A0A6ZLY1_9HYME|nr:ATP synthase F0 subunit 8 [Pselaphanus sp. QL-2013]
MPQMSNMNWIFLMFIFLFNLYLLLIMIYYFINFNKMMYKFNKKMLNNFLLEW